MADGDLVKLLSQRATRLAGPISFGPTSAVYLGISEKGVVWNVTLEDGLSPLLSLLEPERIAQLSSPADNQWQTALTLIRGLSGLMDALSTLPEVTFGPPERVAISIETGPAAGGGFLARDPDKDEYIGALELKFGSWGIKAIGILSTTLPDRSRALVLLLLLYADLPRFHIAFNIFFEGIGGILGLQRGADSDAIQAGLVGGQFDDLLFPANPVADATRIIDRIRILFPIRRGAFLFGPLFRLTWSTPAIGDLKLGVILTLDNLLGGDGPVSFNRLLLLGQLRIGLPEAEDDQVARIICDFFGYLDFSSGQFGFYARLRDSRLAGGLELTGALVLRIDFGDAPSFLLSVGGFHPRFQDLPSGLPDKIDRIGMAFEIGIVKVNVTCYLALTSATIQFGADLQAKAKLGPVSIDGWLGFDALIYYEPVFRFELDFRTGFTIKFKGRTLNSVDVVGTLSGPGRWHITGRLKFSVLWWDIEKSFDEQWGTQPQLDVPTTSVEKLLRDAYNNRDNWSAALSAGADALVTLSAAPEKTDLLAHPLGQLRISQKVAPLGVTLEKFGETRIEGATRFDLQSVSIGQESFEAGSLSKREIAQEYLARGTYVRLSEEDRLTKPSFELFDVGVVLGTDEYEVPLTGDTTAVLDYETKILTPGGGIDLPSSSRPVTLGVTTITMVQVARQAKAGAAASAKLRRKNRLRPAERNKVVLGTPALALVETDGLSSPIDLQGPEKTNALLAEQRLGDVDGASIQLVEEYELLPF